ncbi:MAG: hypothetical protein ACRDKE_03355 [Solirubrobacterales bacterium]
MGTGVRIPDRVAAVSVGVLWGKKHRDPQPELLPVTDVGIAIVNGGSVVERRDLGSDELLSSASRLADLELPLLTFNAFRFDWLALGSLVDVDALLPLTIDIYSALLPCVADIVDAEGTSGFPLRGEYGVLNPYRVAETNLGYVPGSSDDAIGDAELAAELWFQLLESERVVLAGRTHALSEDSLALLRGERSAFSDTATWRRMVSERPEPKPYRKRSRHQVTFPRIDQRYV